LFLLLLINLLGLELSLGEKGENEEDLMGEEGENLT
jgi:hypothetical protein